MVRSRRTAFTTTTRHVYYYAFGLAEEYLEKPQELAWSLAALRDPGNWSRARHKLACWQKLVCANVDPARQFLLSNIVETYVKLDTVEQIVYDRYLEAAEERKEIQSMQMTWAEELELKGVEKGLAKGLERGRREGMKSMLTQLMQRRFGRVPSSILEKLSRLEEPAHLEEFGARILEAKSLDDLDF